MMIIVQAGHAILIKVIDSLLETTLPRPNA